MTTKETWRVVPSVPWLLASSQGRIMHAPVISTPEQRQGRKQYGGVPTFGSWDGKRARMTALENPK